MKVTIKGIDYEAWLEKEGGKSRYPEYREDHKEKEGLITCEAFVEIVEGDLFSINLSRSRVSAKLRTRDLKPKVTIDGEALSSYCWMSNQLSYYQSDCIQKDSDGNVMSSSLCFQRARTVDSAQAAVPSMQSGVIAISLERGRLTKSGFGPGGSQPMRQEKAFQETKAKLGTLVGTKNAKKVVSRDLFEFDPCPIRPVVVNFVFKYRTRQKLILMEVIDDPLHRAALASQSRPLKRSSLASSSSGVDKEGAISIADTDDESDAGGTSGSGSGRSRDRKRIRQLEEEIARLRKASGQVEVFEVED